MRITFLLLLAANLALLAWFQHFSLSDSAVDPEPARRQISPEKIRVLHDREPVGAATTEMLRVVGGRPVGVKVRVGVPGVGS